VTKEVINHLNLIETGETAGNCATAALITLCGDVTPRPEFLEAAYQGTFFIEHLAFAAALELYEQRRLMSHHWIYSHPLSSPLSHKLKVFHDHTRHRQKHHTFQGALFHELIFDEYTFETTSHVVAISNINQSGNRPPKAVLVDTAPTGINYQTPYIRKPKLSKINNRISVTDVIDTALVVMITEPITSPNLQSTWTQKQIDNTVDYWRQEVEWFKTFATQTQHHLSNDELVQALLERQASRFPPQPPSQ